MSARSKKLFEVLSLRCHGHVSMRARRTAFLHGSAEKSLNTRKNGFLMTSKTDTEIVKVGVPVDAAAAERPQRTRMNGRVVSLVPLDPVAHADALFKGTLGEGNERLWAYLFDGPFSTRAAFDSYIQQKASTEDPLFFAILDNSSGDAVGHAAYMRMEPAHRVIEVGSILYTPGLQRTVGATEAMYLMARHVFEDLGYRRYEWKCNALNAPSRRAALRLGFTFEGIFRQHMIIKGRNRDTAWFSMLDSEWPKRKTAFERWLDPANFDASGRQKVSLSALNRDGGS
jgi:RimJ/RimL family protein N-acetyltransferase